MMPAEEGGGRGVELELDLEPVHAEGYAVGAAIGEGSFGKVVEATHRFTSHHVAVKVFDKAKLSDPVYEDQKIDLGREGAILRRLDHPNILWLIQIIDTPRIFCLVTEYAEINLLELLERDGPCDEGRARVFTRQLISAVEHMHEHKVVHRDLKPDNIMLAADGTLRVIDFGLSNLVETVDSLLETQCGTMCYSAPEMLCNKAYGREVDIWSIGVCLYVMLTQRLPYYSPSLTELHAVMLDGAFQPPEGSSDTLTDLLRNLFVVKPERRITIPQMWGHPWLDAPAPAQGRSRAESSSDREGGSRAKGVVGSLSADGKDRGKGTARPPRVDRRPSCVHLNYAVIAAIEADGIGRAAEIEAAVQGNLCNRLSAEYNLRVLAAQRGSATGGRSLTRHHASTSSIDDFGKWYRQHPPAKSADSGGALTGSGTHGVPHGVSGGTRANAIPQPLASRDRVAEMSTRHRTSGLTRRSSASAIVPGPTAGGGGRGGGTDGPKLTLRPRPRRESASTATGHRFQRSNSGRSNSGDSLDVPASTPERGGSASASVSTAGTGRPPVSPSPSSRRGRGGATSTESGSDRGEHKGHRERGESTRDRDRGRPSSIELAAQRSPTARRGLRRGQSVGSLGIGASAEGGGSTRERDREHSTHRDRGPPRSISGTSHQSSDSDLTAFFAEVETVAAEQERSYASVRRIYSDGTGSGSKKGAKPSGSKVARSLNSSPILSMKSPRSHRRSSSGGDLDDLVEGGYLAPPAEHTTPPTPLHGGRLPSPRLGRPSPNTRRASESGRRVTSARVGPPKPPRGKPSSKRPATAAARKSTRVPW